MPGTIAALHLFGGEMLDLEGDSVFHPGVCEIGCPHRTQNVEVIDVVVDGSSVQVTARNSNEQFEETVPAGHRFVLA
jgi:hypothetical protein